MTSQEKLTAVFNKYAGKVVYAAAFSADLDRALNESLTAEEMNTLLTRQSDGSFDMEANLAALIQKSGDGSYGVYSCDQGAFYNTAFLEAITDVQTVPEEIADKLVAALDAVLKKAPDFSADVKKGILKPLPPSEFF